MKPQRKKKYSFFIALAGNLYKKVQQVDNALRCYKKANENYHNTE